MHESHRPRLQPTARPHSRGLPPDRIRAARLLVALTVVASVSDGCRLPARAVAPVASMHQATRTDDPRETDPWFAAGRRAIAEGADRIAGKPRARNVILFVGDGMGISTITAARIYEGQMRGERGEDNRLAFEELPHVALAKTYSTDAQVADSASTMTAIVSGVKTRTGVIGVSDRVERGDHESVAAARVLTLLEEAEDRGLATGIVSTTTLTHATPASCYAHAALRLWEDDSRLPEAAREAGFPDIARQLLELSHGDGVEVALGGGRSHFRPKDATDPEHPDRSGHRLDGRDLTREWVTARPDSAYVWSRDQLAAIDLDATRHLLGLFEPGHMQFELDRPQDPAGEPSLAELTAIAIDLLSRNDRGYFLMVEAGRIDHAHHASNAARALIDTVALSDAVRTARARTDPDETLIVVTADHSHTLTISGYPRRGNPILGKVVGIDWWRSGGGGERLARDVLGLPYTTLSYANGPGETGASLDRSEDARARRHTPCEHHADSPCRIEDPARGRPDLTDVDTQSPDYLQEATVPLGAETHAGEDVPVYAGGPRAALFNGVREQHYLYHAMVEALGWTRGGKPVD